MSRVELDPSIARTVVDGFSFPLGVYPVEAMTPGPRPGYVVQFEAADGEDAAPRDPGLGSGDADQWEEWPDRFMFDVLLPASRLKALSRVLFSLLPGRVYPILDVLGSDAFREVDPYIAYDLVGVERFFDAVRQYGDWLYEDGLVGFGALSLEPFIYLFVDEHKAVTIRVEIALKEKIERILAAFDLSPVEEIRGADAAAHEHRSVLLSGPDHPDFLMPDEIVERLRETWLLELNVDPQTNVDDEGKELGITAWRCLVRCAEQEDAPLKYAEVLLSADCLETAERLAEEAVMKENASDKVPWFELEVVAADRLTEEQLAQSLGEQGKAGLETPEVKAVRWLETIEE